MNMYGSKIEIYFVNKFLFFAVDLALMVEKKMSKRKAGSDSKRQFNKVWENEFLFIASPSGKPMCIVCESTLSDYRSYDLRRHCRKYQAEIE